MSSGYYGAITLRLKILRFVTLAQNVVEMVSPLENSLERYKNAIAGLTATKPPSSEQILEVLFARDAVQAELRKGGDSSATILLTIFQADSQLKQNAGLITRTITLADWRTSFNPSEEAWWWFLEFLIQEGQSAILLRDYKTALEALEKGIGAAGGMEAEELVSRLTYALVARDALQKHLDEGNSSSEDLIKVGELDKRFRTWVELVSKQSKLATIRSAMIQLDDLREIVSPPEKAWWWFPRIPIHWWDRFDPAWSTLTILWLTATFSLLTDISSRFLSGGGPGTFGAFAVIFQSILALAGGGALTKTGQSIVERTLTSWRVPKHWWQTAKFAAASLLLLLFVGFRLSLSQIAIKYNDAGLQDYLAGQLGSAESKFKRALALNPDNVTVHYNLGVLYEDLGDLKQAEQQYNLAVAGGFVPAHNNLARLYILSKNYSGAVNLLLRGIFLAENREVDITVKHDLFKNMGWARLQQSYYEEAKESLETAIDLAGQQQEAGTHCLLAQTLEKLEENQEALPYWKNCSDYPRNPYNPEEDDWQHVASERLKK